VVNRAAAPIAASVNDLLKWLIGSSNLFIAFLLSYLFTLATGLGGE
jgi:hypothetical protein